MSLLYQFLLSIDFNQHLLYNSKLNLTFSDQRGKFVTSSDLAEGLHQHVSCTFQTYGPALHSVEDKPIVVDGRAIIQRGHEPGSRGMAVARALTQIGCVRSAKVYQRSFEVKFRTPHPGNCDDVELTRSAIKTFLEPEIL